MLEQASIIERPREEVIAQLDTEARRRCDVSGVALLLAYRDGMLENAAHPVTPRNLTSDLSRESCRQADNRTLASRKTRSTP